MKRLLRWLEEALWPRGLKCLCCDELSEGELLCPTCVKALEAMRLSGEEAGADNVCSVYRYDGAAKQLVLMLKEGCIADAAFALAEGMADAVRDMKLPEDTVLTWVAMPGRRRKQRGIDHGRTLCEAVAARTGLPVRSFLTRTGNLHTQRGLNREARLQNLSGTIACSERINVPVLLIDDVLTTGATASACAQVLMAAGAPRVYALTATKAMLRTGND